MLAEEELSQYADPELLGASAWIATGLRIEETKCVTSRCRANDDLLTVSLDFPSRMLLGR